MLAQSDWLVMLYPSAYSSTAAEVGFGAAGILARTPRRVQVCVPCFFPVHVFIVALYARPSGGGAGR